MSTLSSPRTPRNLPLLLGESAAITSLRREIEAAARTDAKVLVLGETGSGKEVVARLIHDHSSRSSRAFVAVNCSGIPETLLESELFGHTRGSFTGAYRDKPGLVRQADRGTLFLDELGEMSLRMQAVLLRFAETGEIQTIGVDGVTGRSDVRLITATNRNLRERIDAGVFREDLYFRLNIIQIHVPALRERPEDVMLLLRHYLRKASETHRLHCPELTPEAEQMLSVVRLAGQCSRVEEPRRATCRAGVGSSNRCQRICRRRFVAVARSSRRRQAPASCSTRNRSRQRDVSNAARAQLIVYGIG